MGWLKADFLSVWKPLATSLQALASLQGSFCQRMDMTIKHRPKGQDTRCNFYQRWQRRS